MHINPIKTDRPRMYVQPVCKLIILNTQHHILAGSYGENGQAGGSFGNDNTNDYNDELL